MSIPRAEMAEVGDGIEIHYQVEGSGEPVLFLHGSGPGASGYSNFKGNIPALTARGLRALVPDLPGYGYSSKPEDRAYTLDFFVDCAFGLLDVMGVEKCHLLGNSLGGAIAFGMALRHPERIGRMVQMAPGGIETREDYFAMPGINKMMQGFLGGDLDEEGLGELLAYQVYDPNCVDADTIKERFAILQIMNQQVLASMDIPNLEDRLGEITSPLLFFWGRDDQFMPLGGAHKIWTRCPDARGILLPRCGHWVMVEHPHTFNKVSGDFLLGVEH